MIISIDMYRQESFELDHRAGRSIKSRPSIASWLPAVFTAAHDHPRTHSVHIQYDIITADYILQSTSLVEFALSQSK